jgi:hypothetical protein
VHVLVACVLVVHVLGACQRPRGRHTPRPTPDDRERGRTHTSGCSLEVEMNLGGGGGHAVIGVLGFMSTRGRYCRIRGNSTLHLIAQFVDAREPAAAAKPLEFWLRVRFKCVTNCLETPP